MAEFKFIYILAKFENFVGIYRNYIFRTSLEQTMICLRVALEIAIYSITLKQYFEYVSFILKDSVKCVYVLMYIVACGLHDCIILIESICSAKHYKEFLWNLKRLNKICTIEPSHIKSIKRMKSILTITFITFIAVKNSTTILMTSLAAAEKKPKPILAIIYDIWNQTHYILINFVIYSFIIIIHNYLKYLNHGIETIILKIENKQENLILDGKAIVEYLENWMEIYSYLVNCSNHVSKCFQYQVSIVENIIIGRIFVVYHK